MELLGDLLQSGVSAQLRQKPLVHRPVIFQGLTHFSAHTAFPGLQCHRPGHGLADGIVPDAGIIAAGEAGNHLPQPHAALLDQVHQQHTVACKLPGDFRHPAKTGTRQSLLGLFVSIGCLAQQFLRLLNRRQGFNFFQVQPQGVIGAQILQSHVFPGHLLLLPEPQGRLAHKLPGGKRGDIQLQSPVLQGGKRILYPFFGFLLQKGKQLGRAQAVPVSFAVHPGFPRGIPKRNIHIDHSRKSSNPILVPIAWSLSIACFSTCRTRSLEMPSFSPMASRE